MRRLVVGWNVNRRLLDLAFLVAAVEHRHTAGALDFFFSGRSFTSKDRFRQALTGVCGTSSGDSTYAIDGRGLVSRYGGEERVLWWNQDVLVLPPLFELLCTINPDSMMRDCHALGKDGIGADDVKTVASGWQNRMYHWLRELTGASAEDADPLASLTQQRVRHFSYMVKWLRADASAGGARDAVSPLSDLLDDERVLAFWRHHWPNRSPGKAPTASLERHAQADSESAAGSERYRSFALVAELAVHLWSATDAGLAKMSPQLSIMVRAGEGDGTIAEDALDLSEIDPGTDSESLLRALGSPPLATIKFLKDSEKRAVEPIVSAGAAVHRMFSVAVAAALLYLLQQQFPQEVRGMVEWADARLEAVASRAFSLNGKVSDANESGLQAGAAPSEAAPLAGEAEVVAEVVPIPEVRDATPPDPTRRDPQGIPPVASGPSPDTQELAVEPVSPDASGRLDRDTARIRRDALAALAERMETLAIERAF